MFVHGGWLHLLGNLLLLYLTGPFIEDLWGRPVFAAFYLTMGVLSALMYASHYPNFTGPLIGASGAIAGVMGAFLINFWKTKMRFFYWIAFFFRGTFEAPAFVMLPLWVVLEFFNASVMDSVNAQGGGGGVAHWAHVWGFVFGVLVALGMRHLKIEEKYIHPKLEAKLESQEGAVDVVITALQKRNLGRMGEAYGLLLEEVHKNPFRSDVVDALWDIGLETGHGDEAAKFFVKLIESEIRHDRIEVAWNRYKDLQAKVPQASIHPTYKFALLKFLIQSRDIEEANQLASELLQKLDVKSPPVLLQNFAQIAKVLGQSVAKKALDLCLQHPEISDESKETMKKELTSSEGGSKAPSVQRDEDLSVEPA
jgi:membrane associated rhomboid family serine protease